MSSTSTSSIIWKRNAGDKKENKSRSSREGTWSQNDKWQTCGADKCLFYTRTRQAKEKNEEEDKGEQVESQVGQRGRQMHNCQISAGSILQSISARRWQVKRLVSICIYHIPYIVYREEGKRKQQKTLDLLYTCMIKANLLKINK